MRVIFMGTPAFAVPCLEKIQAAGHELLAVYSQPPRMAGRGQQLHPSPTHLWAQQQGIRVHHPLTLKNPEEQEIFANYQADIAVVVAYGLILPKAILQAPAKGCINVHASLLPRWRGAAPIQRAIQAGDQQTGICIMQMDAGLDTGAVLSHKALDIAPLDTSQTLQDKLAAMGAELLIESLTQYSSLTPQPQPLEGVNYAHKINKAEGAINWQKSATELERQIRAFTPWPGSWFSHKGEIIKVWQASVTAITPAQPAGLVLNTDDGLLVACGQHALRITALQRPGRSIMQAADFLRGFPIEIGSML
ncbi:MAG: methionyl-tRNA formyltransferase [Alphaproteobacteria bacterium]